MSLSDIEKVAKGASYSALLLHDSGLPITAANISTLFKAAKINGNEPTFKVFEDFLKVNSITNFIGAIGGSAPAATSAPAAASAPAKKEEPKKEEPKEEEADMDMGDLFG